MARSRASQRRGADAAVAALACCCCCWPVVECAFLKTGTNYITPSCGDLASAFLDIAATVAAGTQASYNGHRHPALCGRHGRRGVVWPTPDYGCLTSDGEDQPIALGLDVTKPTTVAIAADKATCLQALPRVRPTLSASQAIIFTGVPLLTLGNADPSSPSAFKLKVSISGINFDGVGARSAIRALNLASLKLTSVDITNTAEDDYASALYVQDTPTAYACTSAAPCHVSSAFTAWSMNSMLGFPSAGGALGVAAVTKGAAFSASYVTFEGNQHCHFGGVFGVFKKFSGALPVKFNNCEFKKNNATICSVGVTGRDDATPKGIGGNPILANFKGTSFSGNTAVTPETRIRCGLVCGLRSSAAAWSAAKITQVSGLPGRTAGQVHLVAANAFTNVVAPLVDPYATALGFKSEFLVVDETSPVR